MTPTPVPASSPISRRRRLVRLAMISGVSAILLAVVATFILTRPSVFTSIFASSLSSRLGAEVTIGSGHWQRGARFTFNDITIRAPGMEGVPGEVATISSLDVDINLASFFTGASILESVDVGPTTLRIAEHVSDGADLNVGRLFANRSSDRSGPAGAGAGGGIPSLPDRIALDSLTIERGRYDGRNWFHQGSVELSGEAVPDRMRPGAYAFNLLGRPSEAGEFIISGMFDPNTKFIDVELSKGVLDQRVITLLPLSMRKWNDRMDLKGAVQKIDIQWEVGQNPSVEVALNDVELTVPPQLGLGDFWSRYRDQGYTPSPDPPRMFVSDGRIILQGDLLSFRDLHGRFTSDTDELLAEIPFTFDMTIRDLPSASMQDGERWVEELGRLPFTLNLRTDAFTLGTAEGEAMQADLPRIVAQILSMFRVVSCTVDTDIRAERGEPIDGVAAPIEFDGRLSIKDASGAYEGFAYPLEHLDAHIEFDTTTVYVRAINADGAGDSKIRLSGEVVPLGDGSFVDMSLDASNLPLDSLLVDAMPDSTRSTMRSLFRRHGADRPSGDGTHDLVDLQLEILRERGPRQPTRLQGEIDFDRMNLTWDSFPYSIRLAAGRLRWIGDELRLENEQGGAELLFETDDGGIGIVSGSIMVPLDDQSPSGRLEFNIQDQPVTDAFIDALSYVAEDAATLMRSLDLEGDLKIVGPIEVDGLGESRWDLAIQLMGGAATPQDEFADLIGVEGPFWSTDLQLDQVDAVIHATAEQVAIRSFIASGNGMDLDISGRVHLQDDMLTELDIQADGVQIQDRMLQFAPDTIRPELAELWRDWSPAGRMDLLAEIRGHGPGRSAMVAVDRLDVELTFDGTAEQMRMIDGEIVIDRDELRIDDVRLQASVGGLNDGLYDVVGRVDWSGGGTSVKLDCGLRDGRFQSPLLGGMLEAFVYGDFPEYWNEAEPSGSFEGAAELQLEPGSEWQWQFDVTPTRMAATVRDVRIDAAVEHGRLRARNGVLHLDNLSFATGPGRGRISGELKTDGGLWGQLDFDYDGMIRSDEVFALIPEPATAILESINFRDGSSTSLQDAELTFDLRPGMGMPWSMETEVLLSGAEVGVGVDIAEVFGRADMRLGSVPGAPLRFGLDGEFDSLDVLGQRLRHSTIGMRLLEDGVRLSLDELSGDFAGGELVATAMFDLGDAQEWSLQVQIADAGLSRFMAPDGPPDTEMSESNPTGGESESADGRVFASANLAGSLEEVDRVGNGRLRIYEGELYQLPFTVGIYQLLQLSTPFIKSPEFVDVVWHLDDDDIVLEVIRLQSLDGDAVTFSLNGEGTFDWATKTISAILRPRSSWIVLADVFGALQDRFYAVSVEGPVKDPQVELISFPDLQ